MATIKYFSDWQNEIIELQYPHNMLNHAFEMSFPGVKGRKYDSFSRFVGYRPGTREILPVTRTIEFKSHPSLHVCSSKCMNATGKSCECSCGGKNHGHGNFICH